MLKLLLVLSLAFVLLSAGLARDEGGDTDVFQRLVGSFVMKQNKYEFNKLGLSCVKLS